MTLEGESVRPTTDRVKESLFNILQFQIEGRTFLDLFAGSGQIGLEAVSRGASQCIFVDASKKSINVVEKNIEETGLGRFCKVYNADSLMFIKRPSQTFDVAFMDPPYNLGLLQEALPHVANAMSDGGVIVCEHPRGEVLPEEVEDFVKSKTYKYGKICLTTYRHKDIENN